MEQQIQRLRMEIKHKHFGETTIQSNLRRIVKFLQRWREQVKYDIFKLEKEQESDLDNNKFKIQITDLNNEYEQLSKMQLNILETLSFKK